MLDSSFELVCNLRWLIGEIYDEVPNATGSIITESEKKFLGGGRELKQKILLQRLAESANTLTMWYSERPVAPVTRAINPWASLSLLEYVGRQWKMSLTGVHSDLLWGGHVNEMWKRSCELKLRVLHGRKRTSIIPRRE